MKNISTNSLTRALAVMGLAVLAFQAPAAAQQIGEMTVTVDPATATATTHDVVPVTVTVANNSAEQDAVGVVLTFSPPKGLKVASMPDICSLSHLSQGEVSVACDIGGLAMNGGSLPLSFSFTSTKSNAYSFAFTETADNADPVSAGLVLRFN